MTVPSPDPHVLAASAPDTAVTGAHELDGVVAELDGLAERPLTEHVAVFEQVHAALSRALADGPPVDGAPAAGRA